jgi:hypothetical protein
MTAKGKVVPVHVLEADAQLHLIVTLPYCYNIEAKQSSQMHGRDTDNLVHLSVNVITISIFMNRKGRQIDGWIHGMP